MNRLRSDSELTWYLLWVVPEGRQDSPVRQSADDAVVFAMWDRWCFYPSTNLQLRHVEINVSLSFCGHSFCRMTTVALHSTGRLLAVSPDITECLRETKSDISMQLVIVDSRGECCRPLNSLSASSRGFRFYLCSRNCALNWGAEIVVLAVSLLSGLCQDCRQVM
jgi:hypothetical protein